MNEPAPEHAPAPQPDRRYSRGLVAAAVFLVACTGSMLTVGALGTFGAGPPTVDPIVLVPTRSTPPTTAPPTVPTSLPAVAPARTAGGRCHQRPSSRFPLRPWRRPYHRHPHPHPLRRRLRSARATTTTAAATTTATATATAAAAVTVMMTVMMTAAVTAMTDTPASPVAGRHGWGIRQRVLAGYLALVIAALGISLVVTRQTLISRLERDIDAALVQEIEEVRLLATGDDPDTGAPFGTDVAAIFRTFLGRSVPGESEAFYTFVNGRYFLRDFEAPAELLDDPALLATWTGVTGPTLTTSSTSLGEARSLAVPLLGDDGRALGVFVIVHFPADDRAEITRVVQVSAIAGLAVLGLVGAVAWSIAGRVLRPISELTETARGITETDLSGRIPVTGHDELSELGATFNAMIDRLERGFTGQRQFLDDVAHELRTPITIVQGHLELMGDDPTDRAETLAVVHDELDRMNRYVHDLLLLAKSETTEFLRPEPIDLGELAEMVQSRMPALGDRRWTVDIAPAPGALAIVGDPGRLTQAVLNLATNAVQHTVPGDVIAFGIEPTGNGARLWVRDTGTGLEPGLADRLFDRRFRGAASRAGRADGMGLGLSIVAAIVRAHHGEIAATDDPNGGARFTITLPLEPPHPNPDEEPTP